MTKQLTALEARKWMVENPDISLRASDGNLYYWDKQAYHFYENHLVDGWCCLKVIGPHLTFEPPSSKPQRPTHLTLENVDEWFSQAREISLNHPGCVPKFISQRKLAGWSVDDWLHVRFALRDGSCTVEVIKWRSE